MSVSPHSAFADAWIDGAVHAAHPDYVAVLVVAAGLEPGPTSRASEAALLEAEAFAIARLAGREPHDLPEVLAWRRAYQGFGVKPREARSSVEALLRRASAGLPRINRLTDAYNAVSVMSLMPIGGEDLSGYEGPARLVVAAGDETFDTVADGLPTVQTVAAGEIAWRDDAGVTCRRWNWRQCVRTRLTESTTAALFIIDGLGSDARSRAEATADDLVVRLRTDSPGASFTIRTLAAE
jgi:DNA/RNA-binding domain of Phe-tRNA-synthetase-like protein